MFVRESLQRLATELGVRTAFLGETFGDGDEMARTLVLLRDGEVFDDFVYPVVGTPTAHIVDHGACFHSRGASAMYPADESLPLFGSESYFGVAIHDPFGRRIGHVAVLDDRPFPDPKALETRLRQFASELAELLVPGESPSVDDVQSPLATEGSAISG